MLFSTIRWGVVAAICLGVAAAGLAEEKKWKNETELSYVQTGGNTETTTLAFKNWFKYQFTKRLKGAWTVGALNAESDGERVAEKYMTELRADFKLRDKSYLYGLAGYLTDEFAGIEKRVYGGLGGGYAFLTGPAHFLSAELGLNYSTETYIDETEDQFIEARGYLLYEYAIGEKSRLSQGLEYLHVFDEGDNFRINSDTALKIQINSVLSLKVGYEVRYDNAPTPDTLDQTDTRFYTAIAADF